MAVRHGYGKIAGADALVFAYDTGDTRNSYRGEPTENLITNPLPTSTSGFSRSGGTGTVTYDEVEKAIKWEQTAYSSWGTYFNFYPAFTGTLDINAQYTFSLEYKSENEFADSNMFHQVVQGNGQSPATTNTDITSDTYGEINGWKQYRVTFTPANSGVSSAYNRFITGNRDTDVLRMWFRNIQFEKKSHKTQFTTGTRSATQGLLDLTGNSTVDLTNANYNSAAQVDFDGTGDYLRGDIDPSHLQGDYTIETVFKHEGTSQWEGVWSNNVTSSNWDNTVTLAPLLTFNGTSYPSTQYQIGHNAAGVSSNGVWLDLTSAHMNRYIHVVLTRSGTTIKIYAKWTGTDLETTGTFSSHSIIPKDNFVVGRHWYNSGNSNQMFNGQIPIVKIYNRALTAAEVKNNFNNYKKRFNL